jgi:hypothetical protein
MFGLQPPRHISTLPFASVRVCPLSGHCGPEFLRQGRDRRVKDGRGSLGPMAIAPFTDGTARTLDLSWEIPLSCGLINAGREGGVRLAMLLEAQTPHAVQRIEEAVSQATRPYIRGASFHIPIAATLASAGVAR